MGYSIRAPLYNPSANGLVEKLNKMVKGAMKWALASGKNVRDMIMDLTWAYRTTRNQTNGQIQFDLMRSRKAGSRLYPRWMRKLVSGTYANGEDVVLIPVQRMRIDNIQPGDLVKVKPGRVSGSFNTFRRPYRVRAVLKFQMVHEEEK